MSPALQITDTRVGGIIDGAHAALKLITRALQTDKLGLGLWQARRAAHARARMSHAAHATGGRHD